MTSTGMGNSAQGAAAQILLFCFTIILALKIDQRISLSWWIIFVPLWLFHYVVSPVQFSFPDPALLHGCHWAPLHAIVAEPLLISFEFLLCTYLQTKNDYLRGAHTLMVVFLPLLAFEVIILIDNFRMYRVLEEENVSNEVRWESWPVICISIIFLLFFQHLFVVTLMIFLLPVTIFTILKLCGDIDLGWWVLFLTYGMQECFAFLICKISNTILELRSLSIAIHHLDWQSDHLLSSFEEERHNNNIFCGLQDIGDYFITISLITFQILLCGKLEGLSSGAKSIPILVLFVPLFVLQGFGVLFSLSRLIKKLILLLRSGPGVLHHGSRLLGWWSIDDGSTEEQARLFQAESTGYNTFCGYPPEVVKKMPKKDLVEEVRRLQAALGEQTEITKCTQQEFESLQNDKILCRICYEGEICTVLIPCRHRTLCMVCAEKCEKCPICRAPVDDRMLVFDV